MSLDETIKYRLATIEDTLDTIKGQLALLEQDLYNALNEVDQNELQTNTGAAGSSS